MELGRYRRVGKEVDPKFLKLTDHSDNQRGSVAWPNDLAAVNRHFLSEDDLGR